MQQFYKFGVGGARVARPLLPQGYNLPSTKLRAFAMESGGRMERG